MPGPLEPPALSEEGAATIQRYEAAVASIIKARTLPPKPEGFFDKAPVISMLTAVITVTVTASATTCAQMVQQDRQTTLTRAEARAAAIGGVMDSLGMLMAELLKSDEDRLKMARGKWDHLDDSLLIRLVTAANTVDERWRINRARFGLALQVATRGDSTVSRAWKTTEFALDSLNDCAGETFEFYNRSVAPDTICKAMVGRAGAAVDRLFSTVSLHIDTELRLRR